MQQKHSQRSAFTMQYDTKEMKHTMFHRKHDKEEFTVEVHYAQPCHEDESAQAWNLHESSCLKMPQQERTSLR